MRLLSTFLGFLAAQGIVSALPKPGAPDIATLNGTFSESDIVEIAYTADQIHDNVMSNFPAERIINSSDIGIYLAAHAGEPTTVLYLFDQRGFYPTPGNETILPHVEKRLNVERRQWCDYHEYYIVRSQVALWDPWLPVSDCTYNGYGGGPAFKEVGIQWTKSIEFNFGFDVNIIKDVISASFGVSVGSSVTHVESQRCQIEAGSVGQVWARVQNVFTGLRHMHRSCGVDWEEGGTYWALAPITGSGFAKTAWGCSTGSTKVWCSRNYGVSNPWR